MKLWKKFFNRDRKEVLTSVTDNPVKKTSKERLVKKIDKNIKKIEDIIGISSDVIIRNININNHSAALVFIDGLVDKQTINESILQPLLKVDINEHIKTANMLEYLETNILTVNETLILDSLEEMIEGILNGDTVLLLDNYKKAIVLSSKGWEQRSITDPPTESVIRGPREGFTENIRVNTSLIRRKIKSPALRIKNYNIGRYSRTNVSICYIEGLTNKHLLEELTERIKNIDIDYIAESGYIEQLIEDESISPFPQMLSTERPDRVAANLQEGRIAVLTDGSPFALVLPLTITVFLHSPEDYYDRFIIASFIRLIRLFAAFVTLTLPSLYIAAISFHPEMIPTRLALAFAGGRGQVPFPSYIEAFAMEAIIELLREGSLRLPSPIGPTIGIVGALIIGEAAVSASIVSPFMVIIVALTTIASFVVPNYGGAVALRLLRFPLMLITSLLGFYGFMIGIIIISIHLAALKSFGIPYLTPFTPSRISDLKDSILRPPIWLMRKRPFHLRTKNRKKFTAQGDDDRNERTR